MTIEEKRQAIRKHCEKMKRCTECYLDYLIHDTNNTCYSDPDDKIIERNYEVLFGKESEEQNVKEERKTSLRDLLDYVEVPIVISEGDFSNPVITLNALDYYFLEEYERILTPEFLDREVYRIKAGEYKILVALKEVE